jgi:hypothetical protein
MTANLCTASQPFPGRQSDLAEDLRRVKEASFDHHLV